MQVEEGEYCSEACAELEVGAPGPDEVTAVPPVPSEKPCPCGHPACEALRVGGA